MKKYWLSVIIPMLVLVSTICYSDTSNKNDLITSLGGYTLGQPCDRNTIEGDEHSSYVAVRCTELTKVIAIITILYTDHSYEKIRDMAKNRFGIPYSETDSSVVWTTEEKTDGCADFFRLMLSVKAGGDKAPEWFPAHRVSMSLVDSQLYCDGSVFD